MATAAVAKRNEAATNAHKLYAVEAEKAVLGSVLLSDGANWPDVAAMLTADDWALGSHVVLASEMAKLYESAGHVDMVLEAVKELA